MVLSCFIFEIKGDIGRKSRFFHTPCIRRPVRGPGGPRQSIAMPFGTQKLYSVATWWWKKFEDMYNRFDRIPACDGRTDRQTSCDGIVPASPGKNFNESCYTLYSRLLHNTFAKHCIYLIITDKVFRARQCDDARCCYNSNCSVCPSVRHVLVLYRNGLTLSQFLHRMVAQLLL